MDSNMIEKLKSMLDDPETVRALSDTINGIMPQGAGSTPSTSDSLPDNDAYITEPQITDRTENEKRVSQTHSSEHPEELRSLQ